jgi:pimeloyl-ACP methyl ester carboxylesterase
MSRPEIREGAVIDLREALRQGGRAVAQDLKLFARPWGFKMSDVRAPTHVWHGDADTVVRIEHGQWVGEQIPGADTRILAGEGHLLFIDHADEIIKAMKRDFWESAHAQTTSSR